MFGLLKQFNKRQLSQLLTANFGGKKGAKPAGGDKPAAEGKPAPAEDAPKKGGKPKKNWAYLKTKQELIAWYLFSE